MRRREFIKQADLAAAGALLGSQRLQSASTQQGKRGESPEIKNIVLFFVDQQRWDCLGCTGNPVVRTPHIDRLASTGIRFNHAYTPAPVCTPARTSLQTGLWPHNHKLIFNTARSNTRGGREDPEPETLFFSHVLKEEGWRLAHVGKWHIGTDKHKPSEHGYDDLPYYPGYGYPAKHSHYGAYLKAQGVDGFRLLEEKRDPTGYRSYSGLQEGLQAASIPAYLASQTIEVIEQYSAGSDNFFISCNFWGPHAPYNITRKHYEMYRDADIAPWPNFDCDLSDKPGIITRYGEYWKTGWFTRENLPELIGQYYGYISLIDEEIGRVMKALEDAGKLESTLIVFSADHGSSVGSYRFWDKGFGMYDAITRIPMIFSHPSLQPGTSDAFVTLLDLAPTFLECVGYQVPEAMEGTSLVPILNGQATTVREDYLVTEHHGHQLPFWQRMVRTRHGKYIYNPMSRDEYYDLDADPWETKNIIGTVSRSELNRCREILIQWMKETGDPLHFWAEPMLV